MATKIVQRIRGKSEVPEEPRNGKSGGNGTSDTTVAKPTVGKLSTEDTDIYERALKELVALAENDQFAKKIDTGPLGEARGKDTWQLHTQLKMLDEMNRLRQEGLRTLYSSIETVDQHLNQDSTAITNLVQDRTSQLLERVDAHGTGLAAAVENVQKTNAQAVSQAAEDLYQRLLTDIRGSLEELKDINARLIDKRFNQTEIAFASVRADVEIVKSLLTDIIKSRIGRAERQQG